MPCGISGDSLNEKAPTGPPFNGDLFEFGVSFSAESFGTSTGSRERPRRCTSDIEKEESTLVFFLFLLFSVYSSSSSSSSSEETSSFSSSTSTSTPNLEPIDNKPFFCLSMMSLMNSRWRCDFNSSSISRCRISFCWRSTSFALSTSVYSRFLSISSRVCKRSSSKSLTRCNSFKSFTAFSKAVLASPNSTFTSSTFTSTSSGPVYP